MPRESSFALQFTKLHPKLNKGLRIKRMELLSEYIRCIRDTNSVYTDLCFQSATGPFGANFELQLLHMPSSLHMNSKQHNQSILIMSVNSTLNIIDYFELSQKLCCI